MDPLTSYAASWAAGKIASALSPRKSGAAQKRTDATLRQLGAYERSYQDLAKRGRSTMDIYDPQLNAATSDYADYIKSDYGADAQDSYDINQASEGVAQDARRASARVARSLPPDSVASGAATGAQTAIEDRALTNQAGIRSQVMNARIQRREASKRALIDLYTKRLMDGQNQLTTGLSGGMGALSPQISTSLGRESNALSMDAGQDQGWQGLISEIARAEEAKKNRDWYSTPMKGRAA